MWSAQGKQPVSQGLAVLDLRATLQYVILRLTPQDSTASTQPQQQQQQEQPTDAAELAPAEPASVPGSTKPVMGDKLCASIWRLADMALTVEAHGCACAHAVQLDSATVSFCCAWLTR